MLTSRTVYSSSTFLEDTTVDRSDERAKNLVSFPSSPAEQLEVIRRMLARNPAKRASALMLLKRHVDEGTYRIDPTAIAVAILKKVSRNYQEW